MAKKNKRSLNVFLACKEALWSEKEQRKGMSKGNKGREPTHGSLRSLTYFFVLFPQCEACSQASSFVHAAQKSCSLFFRSCYCGMWYESEKKVKECKCRKKCKGNKKKRCGGAHHASLYNTCKFEHKNNKGYILRVVL